MTQADFPPFASPNGAAGPAPTMAAAPGSRSVACVVRLIDRQTGQTHHTYGRPLVPVTRNPVEGVADLLTGRSAAIWEARIEPVGPEVRR